MLGIASPSSLECWAVFMPTKVQIPTTLTILRGRLEAMHILLEHCPLMLQVDCQVMVLVLL